jgi:hypothetical protein
LIVLERSRLGFRETIDVKDMNSGLWEETGRCKCKKDTELEVWWDV